MKQIITETQSLRRAIFIVEAKDEIDLIARNMLHEGDEYNTYLELTEAPIGDVINKLKSGLSKLPTQAAKKATSLIKKVPKSAWPIAAGVILSMAGADPAAAGDLSTLADGLEKLEQLARELGPTAGERAAAAAGSAADVAQGAAEISMDQLKQANRMLGGGDANTIKELIQNGVDLDKVKSLLDKFDVTNSLDISQSLQQIEGNNLVPMIQWIQRMY